MRRHLELWILLPFFVAVTALSGCKPAAPSGDKVFANAPAELKTAWQQASSAAGSNDYAGALLILQELRRRPGLTPEQDKALESTAAAVSDKMYDAAAKGDPKAKQALEEIKKARAR